MTTERPSEVLPPEIRHSDLGDTPDVGELPPLDLTPRTGPPTGGDGTPERRATRRRRSGRVSLVIVALLVLAGSFIVVRAVGGATLYFYNADEAVAQRSTLQDKRFRLQGTVVGETVKRTGDGVQFDVHFNGATVPVHHVGDPPQLFQGGIPVVLEGAWLADGAAFSSDRMLIKHTEEYDEKNDDRLRQADEGGKQAPAP